MKGDKNHPLDDICGPDCECEFGFDPDDPEPADLQYHYWRRCLACGHVACAYLHCPHDVEQSRCVTCGELLAPAINAPEPAGAFSGPLLPPVPAAGRNCRCNLWPAGVLDARRVIRVALPELPADVACAPGAVTGVLTNMPGPARFLGIGRDPESGVAYAMFQARWLPAVPAWLHEPAPLMPGEKLADWLHLQVLQMN